MPKQIDLGGTIYISSAHAAEISGYTQDYLGQLAREGSIEGKRVSGMWYLIEESIHAHKKKASEYIPQVSNNSQKKDNKNREVTVSLDGNEYISANRASIISGYSRDYVGQLARQSKIESRRIGNRWLVNRDSLMRHKKEKDSLLAAVQAESVGFNQNQSPYSHITPINVTNSTDQTFFSYITTEESGPLMPMVNVNGKDSPEAEPQDSNTVDLVHRASNSRREIPIRILTKQHYVDSRTTYADENTDQGARGVSALSIFYIVIPVIAAITFGTLFYMIGYDFGLNQIGKVRTYSNQISVPFIEDIMSKQINFSRNR